MPGRMACRRENAPPGRPVDIGCQGVAVGRTAARILLVAFCWNFHAWGRGRPLAYRFLPSPRTSKRSLNSLISKRF